MYDLYNDDAFHAQKRTARDILERLFIWLVVCALALPVALIAIATATLGTITDGVRAVKTRRR